MDNMMEMLLDLSQKVHGQDTSAADQVAIPLESACMYISTREEGQTPGITYPGWRNFRHSKTEDGAEAEADSLDRWGYFP